MNRMTILAGLIALVAGCSGEPVRYPARGTVTIAGQPVAAGGLIFFLESEKWNGRVVNANVKADGTFELETYYTGTSETSVKPGTPAGTYKVFYHPPGDGQKVGAEIEVAERVTIKAGTNELTIVVPEKKVSPEPAGQ